MTTDFRIPARTVRKGTTLEDIWTEGREWIKGPFTITHVVGAYSGPSYVVKVQDANGEPDIGKVFTR